MIFMPIFLIDLLRSIVSHEGNGHRAQTRAAGDKATSAAVWLDEQLRELKPNITISGMAAGADQIFAELALKQHISLAAADIVLAVWDGNEWGGTWDTIAYARKKGKEIRYFSWTSSQPVASNCQIEEELSW